MSKGQRKSRVGVGMKPRGIQGDKMQKAVMVTDASSGTEGQTETSIQPVFEAQYVEQRGPTLEQENSGLLESEKQPAVADQPTEMADFELKKALKMSSATGPTADQTEDYGVTKYDPETGCRPNSEVNPDGSVVDAEFEEVAPYIPTMAEHEEAVREGRVVSIASIEEALSKGANVSIAPNGDVKIGGTLGPRADGSYGIVLTVPEGYWDAVQQWAEADGVTAEEWCNMRFTEFVETWSSPAKGR
jgi:hypothetical protein